VSGKYSQGVYIETPPPPLPSRGGISPNGNWAENIKRGREKRGKCEGIGRKNKDKGDVQKGKKMQKGKPNWVHEEKIWHITGRGKISSSGGVGDMVFGPIYRP
jgi:hypothetical protein